MKDLEKKIEEAAESHARCYRTNLFEEKKSSFIFGSFSPETKEYWQQGMYIEEEVKRLCLWAMEYGKEKREYAYELIEDWFEQNKKK